MGVGGWGGGHPQYIVDKYECTEYIPLRDGNFKRLNILHRLIVPAYIFFLPKEDFRTICSYIGTVIKYCTVLYIYVPSPLIRDTQQTCWDKFV